MKIVSYNIILPLLALFMMFSCDEKTRVENESSNERITYSAEVAELEIAPINKSGAESTNNEVISVCGDYALVLGSVTPMGEGADEMGTKGGSLTTDNIDQFRVLAYKQSALTSPIVGSVSSGSINSGYLIIKQSGGTWSENDVGQVRFWPPTTDKVNFYAYSTTNSWYSAVSFVSNQHNPPKLIFTTPVPNSSQVDLLIAEAQMNKTYNDGKIKFKFHHALASIGFEVYTHPHNRIKSIAITGVVDVGQAQLIVSGTAPNQYITWSGSLGSSPNIYLASINNHYIDDVGKYGNIMKDDGYLMLIPHDYSGSGNNPKIILTLKDGSSYEFPFKTGVAADDKWVSGKRYIYRILPRYVENGVDRGVGVPVNLGTEVAPNWRIFAPVNCGYETPGYVYGKLYQWGRKHGHGYDSNDATVPTIPTTFGSVSVAVAYTTPNTFYKTNATPDDWCSSQNNFLWNNGTDAAPIKTIYDPCPNGWRVPTKTELVALRVNSSWDSTLKGRWYCGGRGYDVSLQNYGAVFLPAAGYRNKGSDVTGRGTLGLYWSSSSFVSSTKMYSDLLYFDSGTTSTILSSAGDCYRSRGGSVRCIREM